MAIEDTRLTGKKVSNLVECSQGLYRFLDPKFKTFSPPFSKTVISQGYQIVIGDQYSPLKKQEQSFFHGALQMYCKFKIE